MRAGQTRRTTIKVLTTYYYLTFIINISFTHGIHTSLTLMLKIIKYRKNKQVNSANNTHKTLKYLLKTMYHNIKKKIINKK